MYEPDQLSISNDHHQLLAENGTRIAVVLTVNLDASLITGVAAFHRYEDTYVIESCHSNNVMDRVDRYCKLLNYYGDDADVVRKYVQNIIDSQEQSDDSTRFTWDLVTGVDGVENDEDLGDVLSTVISPERLDPPFDVPDDEPVATIDLSAEQHDVLREVNDRYGSAAIRLEQFRGTTYVIGLTEPLARTLSEGCFKLKQEYKNMDFHDSVGVADRVEGIILSAAPTSDGIEGPA